MAYRLARFVLLNLLITVVYVLLADAGSYLKLQPVGLSLLWLPSGFVVAFAILFGVEIFPAIIAGSFWIPFHLELSLQTRVLFGFDNLLTSTLAYLFFRNPHHFHRSFDRLRDSIRFVSFAFFGPALAAFIGAWGASAGQPTADIFWPAWLDWWEAELLSILLFAPAILVWVDSQAEYVHFSKMRAIEVFLETVFLLAIAFFIFSMKMNGPLALPISTFILFCAVVFVSIRSWPRVSSIRIIAIGAIGFAGTLLQRGPFLLGATNDDIEALQLFVVALALIQLFLTSATTQARMALHQAQAAVREREEFLSIASHELKTPMTAVRLQVQALRKLWETDRFRSVDEARPGEMFRVADQQAGRFTSLIDLLLDVTRLSSGKFQIQMQNDVNLSDLAHTVVEGFNEEARQVRSELTAEIDGGIRLVCDPARVEQVMMNLISNALKYGSGKPVQVRLCIEKDAARFEVQDHGCGIASEDIKRLFRKFERAKQTRSVSGLGLGLYITKEIVSAQNGSISVESKVGEGSTFVMYLPLRRQSPIASNHRSAQRYAG